MDNNVKTQNTLIKSTLRIMMIFAGIVLYAVGLKWFVYSANIISSGFTGVGMLLQNLFIKTYHIEIPLTVFNVVLNIIPAIFSYKIIGRKFTVISFVIMFTFTFFTDKLPLKTFTSEPLLGAIFGGILCGFGASLWFKAGVSGGGTDFIALAMSSKYHIQTFNYVMAFNVILIILQGVNYGYESAFYSIIYQYVSTQAINTSYRHYEARTIFIITEKPTLVSKMLIKESGHSSTRFDGIGCYTNNEKYMLYTVVTEPEVRKVTLIVKKYDPNAFVNVLRSNEIQGNFKYLPVDIDYLDENY